MKHAVLLAGFALWFVFLFQKKVDSGPYTYDEADYAYAASLGPVSNAFDSSGPSLLQFVRLGATVARNPARRTELSEAVRGGNDTVLFRHSHGPVFYYFLTALLKTGLSEHAVRFAMAAFPLLSLLVIYVGSLWVLPAGERFPGAILASGLAIWNYAPADTSEVAPHQLFTLLYLAALMALARLVSTGRRKYWYLAVIVCAIAFCTLEVTVVLIATLLITAYIERKQLNADWGLTWRSVLLFAGTVLLLWPGAILRLSIIRSYMIYLYLLLFRKGQWGDYSLGDAWRSRLLNNPLDWVLLIIGLVVFFALPKLPVRRIAYPFLIFGGMMLFTVLWVKSDAPRYVLPFIQAFDIFAAFMLAGYLQRYSWPARTAVIATICSGAGLVAWIGFERQPSNPQPRLSAVLSSIRERNLEQRSMLVPQGDIPTLHYYFPRAQLRGYRNARPTAEDMGSRHFDAVLSPGYPFQLEPPDRVAPLVP